MRVAINKILPLSVMKVTLTKPCKSLCSCDFLPLFFFLFVVYFATYYVNKSENKLP